MYAPDLLIWELTLKCNLRCIHCGSNAGEKREGELTTREALNVVKDAAETGFKGIVLFGGEPFLRKDWSKIAKEIKEFGMKLSIVSGGFLKSSTIIDKLMKIEVDFLQIGIDGMQKTHDEIRGVSGAFNKAVHFIKEAKRVGLPLGIITTVQKKNFKELPKIKEFVIREDLEWQIQEILPMGRANKDAVLSREEYYLLGIFMKIMKKKYSIKIIVPHNMAINSQYIDINPSWESCIAGKKVIGLQSNGNIKGCLALPDEFIEANIRERKLIDIWNSDEFFQYSRKHCEEKIGENCRLCKYAKFCKGGCLARSYWMTGKLYNDPYCFYLIEKDFRDSFI